VQRRARQRKESGLDMGDLQACANPCNARLIIRNWSRGKRFESARRLSPFGFFKPNPQNRRNTRLVAGYFLTPPKDLGRVMQTVAKHPLARLGALEEVEGVSIRIEAISPQGSASFVSTDGGLLGSGNRAKGRVLT
jgi:hypothetical protein